MTVWLIEPRDTLLVRDGRAFSADPGARAASVSFPLPSTTTGGARTRLGIDNQGVFDVARIPDLLARSFRGPLLVELGDSGAVAQWLVPAPADAVLFEATPHVSLRSLVPVEMPPGGHSDLDALDLAPMGLSRPDPRKPATNPPGFWFWPRMVKWLEKPADEDRVAPGDLGVPLPIRESRTHVSISGGQGSAEGPSTGTAVEGALFQTEGLRFSIPRQAGFSLKTHRTALAVALDDSKGMKRCIAALGGERRLVAWREAKEWSLPVLPPTVRDRIVKDRALRVHLVTPAFFENGWRPGRLVADPHCPLHIEAVALRRPQVISGWDLQRREAKPSRRVVPAGSVYFCRVDDTVSEQALRAWLDANWLRALSDGDGDCRDGFGLALFGTWSGKKVAMLDTERSR